MKKMFDSIRCCRQQSSVSSHIIKISFIVLAILLLQAFDLSNEPLRTRCDHHGMAVNISVTRFILFPVSASSIRRLRCGTAIYVHERCCLYSSLFDGSSTAARKGSLLRFWFGQQ
jgi:hypothetical protein